MKPEYLYIKPGPPQATCEIHHLSLDEQTRVLVPLMRARHGNGGLNVCVDCIERLRAAHDMKG